MRTPSGVALAATVAALVTAGGAVSTGTKGALGFGHHASDTLLLGSLTSQSLSATRSRSWSTRPGDPASGGATTSRR